MTLADLLVGLADPAAYPEPPDCVEVRQTHISAVFLAGEFVYKVKKPVNFGFLDFSTPDRRRHFCEEEVRLNRRLAPHVYLGVVPVTAAGGRLRVEGDGEPVEWAVKMVRLPEGTSLLDRLRRDEVGPADVERLAAFLADFHRTAAGGPEVAVGGRFEVVAANARDNFAQTVAHVGGTVSPAVFTRLREQTDGWLDRLRPLIDARAARGIPRDTHGDLHLDHVYSHPDGRPFAIDCIEFSSRFRHADPAADLAFLLMDFRFHHRPDLAADLERAYVRASGDRELAAVLPFYVAYRAVVRAKVEGMEWAEPEVPAADRVAAAARARGHWLLALGVLDEPASRPALLFVGGLSGTGKSHLARRVAAAAGFEVIRADVVRKELSGLRETERGGAGLYDPAHTERTYAECLKRADALLFEGKRVLLDATFRAAARRRAVVELARTWRVPVLGVVCEARPETVRERLAARTGDASDATWQTYLKQLGEWEIGGADTLAVTTDGDADAVGAVTAALRASGLLS
ncbi:bifunctional aminoglycoside phosphotransferase/ATP-binding protein [Urbifossiella limnaea]|uniref:Phosphotransferase enzyme family protein n=1 Tax=Urbifossiella limnaea TaxID=2528023 RepID=A0A517XW13_9BACT|nr:bifunctional aminoglycoside phosphotransferase/ATP-binding protein [Urbifossiella limnaea]QDU21689.1 Phosphotransferase enzyme family protein [Urbifossiella limnaea]